MKTLKETARELFDKNEIDVLLGWRHNPATGAAQPALFKSGEALDELTFDERCIDNLANYLPSLTERYKRVGILLKGCDGRALTTQLVEHRIDRDKILSIAVDCKGVAVNGKEPPKCEDCPVTVSPISDIRLGKGEMKEKPLFKDLEELKGLSPEERWEFFSKHFERCSRCYACRQVCPLCYCEVCVTDQQEPQWIEPSSKLSSNTMWHLIRAYHLAGRCADCGECERVCPQDIPLRLLNNAVERSVIEMFGRRPGTVPDEIPPLVTLSTTDPDSIMGGTS